jgi:hypothetical protein
MHASSTMIDPVFYIKKKKQEYAPSRKPDAAINGNGERR